MSVLICPECGSSPCNPNCTIDWERRARDAEAVIESIQTDINKWAMNELRSYDALEKIQIYLNQLTR